MVEIRASISVTTSSLSLALSLSLSQDITGMTLLTDYKYQFHQAICIEKEGLKEISILP